MKKHSLISLAILFVYCTFAQEKKAEDFGYRHLKCTYKGNTVDILVKSKKGEEQKPKPLFLFIQGSLPVPLLIRFPTGGVVEPFPFKCDSLLNDYHLAIIGKPGLPVIADSSAVQKDFTFIDPVTGKFPATYVQNNLLGYYVHRDIAAIKFLQQQPWITRSLLVVAGHSEGSTIAAKLASIFNRVTHLLYISGSPLGRMSTIVARSRRMETAATPLAESSFEYWEKVTADPENMDVTNGDPNKTTSGFSIPPVNYLKKLKIPVLVVYGTADYSAYANDYLRLQMIQQKKSNFSFNAYIGWEHNFFSLTKEGQPDYNEYNWNTVALDCWHWLQKK